MAVHGALSVDDVFQRLETVKEYVKSRRQIDLSKRDIEFLLEYRDRMEIFRDELAKRTHEVDCIKHILRTDIASTEDSLEELAKFSLSGVTSDVANQIYRNLLLLKTLKLAVHDIVNKTKNASKIAIPRDHNTTPVFYNIIKDNIKRKDLTFDEHLKCVTRLWLWMKTHMDKDKHCRKKTTSLDRTFKEGHAGKPDPSRIVPPTPALSKTPFHPTGPTGIAYQCNLLLNRHPATAKIAALSEYKRISTLEDKLKYILDEWNGLQQMGPRSLTVTQIKAPPKVRSESVGQQTDEVDANNASEKKSKSRKTGSDTDLGGSQNFPSQSGPDDVFLSTSMSGGTKASYETATGTTQTDSVPAQSCALCKQRSIKCSRYKSENEHFSRRFEDVEEDNELGNSQTGRRSVDRQLSLKFKKFDNADDDSDTAAQSFTSGELEELLSIKHLYENLVNGKDESNVSDGRRVMRRRSAPAVRASRTSVSVETTCISALMPSRIDRNNIKVEVTSRAVSARSSGYSPPKKRTCLTKYASTQTEELIDPENASVEQLFGGDDVADECLINSFVDYRQLDNSAFFSVPGRLLFSPDSEATMMWIVSNKLNPGQWRNLFTALMNKSDHIMAPAEIKEDIQSIAELHQGDKMQAVASLELWRQNNGKFPIDILLEALTEPRRRDIVHAIQKYIARQGGNNFK